MERSELEEQTVETVLTRPDVEQALIALIDRLPKIEQSLRRLEDAVDFGMATMKDEAVKEKVDAAIDNSNIQIETLEAAIKLTEKLPMLLQVTNQIESIFTFVQDAYHDEQTKELIGQRIEEYAVPAKEKLSGREICGQKFNVVSNWMTATLPYSHSCVGSKNHLFNMDSSICRRQSMC